MGSFEGCRSERITDDILDQLREYAAAGTPCVLATVVRCEAPTSARPGDKAIITADGRLRGWIGGSCSEPVVRREALRALDEGTPRLVRIVGDSEVKETRRRGELTLGTTCPSGGSLDIFIEPQLAKPLLIVFGDSPAASTLGRLAELTGFRVQTVGQADVPTFETPPGEGYAVVATMGHFDEDALEAALSHPDLDVSLIASTRRASAVRRELLRRGLGEDAVARVRTPAGKARGGTQEEIALLALAEVVIARRQHVAKPHPVAVPAPAFATDPVCGMTVDLANAAHTYEYEGRTFYFCSAGCKASFASDPLAFSASLPES
ncbi:MAG TPA: XdhC family protein [Candidatus Dormibacteraeota bacterium]|nr:XdhC family protein [Candidatus Dormibacteraeota bacterium]